MSEKKENEKKETEVIHKRLNTVSFVEPLKMDVYELPKTPDSEYVVDDSNFIPMSEAVKQLGANNVGADIRDTFYDFPDGKDNGMQIPVTRTKNGKDIAEISQAIIEETHNIADKVESAKSEAKARADFESRISNINKDVSFSKE